MKITVIGTGYVGLVVGAGFAEFGNDVVCVDADEQKINALREGQLPIYEPGLDDLVERNVRERRLSFTTDVPSAVKRAKVIFIAVGTPPTAEGSADLSQVWNVARTIAEHAQGYTLVVNKSTVPVGTADRVREILYHTRPDGEFSVVSNPEFLKEGDAINDFLKPARVIIGTDDQRARETMEYLYAACVRTKNRILFMDARSAEVTKYACNGMLATRISYMNEMARLCDKVGADIEKVRIGMAWDERIGSKFLFAGAGYGGSCFPKDVQAIIDTARHEGVTLNVLTAVHRANETQKTLLADYVLTFLSELHVTSPCVAVWGLSFKPNTDDVREAPALAIVRALLAAQIRVKAHDPVATTNFSEIIPESSLLEYCADNYEAAQGADALIVVTEWAVYRRPDFDRLKEDMRTPALFDGRNIWDPNVASTLGFYYRGIGRQGKPLAS